MVKALGEYFEEMAARRLVGQKVTNEDVLNFLIANNAPNSAVLRVKMAIERGETASIGYDGDYIDFVDTMLNDCGTSDGLADIAARILMTIDYHKHNLDVSEFIKAYEIMRIEALRSAGVPSDIPMGDVDAALRLRFDYLKE